ncbi:hypothetical protein BGX38DRAFT_145074 [Terfezia claveryi]|nr:hypothetical protein BGX38DRAFT_145074 [Terfezia claveryi]
MWGFHHRHLQSTAMCHYYHCQSNSASSFGRYIITGIMTEEYYDYTVSEPRKHKPEIGLYDAQPIDAPPNCSRVFFRGVGLCCLLIVIGTHFATHISTQRRIAARLLCTLVSRCQLWISQNHKYHPAMKPSLEIFTTRRPSWLTRREDALQVDAIS